MNKWISIAKCCCTKWAVTLLLLSLLSLLQLGKSHLTGEMFKVPCVCAYIKRYVSTYSQTRPHTHRKVYMCTCVRASNMVIKWLPLPRPRRYYANSFQLIGTHSYKNKNKNKKKNEAAMEIVRGGIGAKCRRKL